MLFCYQRNCVPFVRNYNIIPLEGWSGGKLQLFLTHIIFNTTPGDVLTPQRREIIDNILLPFTGTLFFIGKHISILYKNTALFPVSDESDCLSLYSAHLYLCGPVPPCHQLGDCIQSKERFFYYCLLLKVC